MVDLGRFTVWFKSWGRNARILVATEPFWSIPMSWVFFYRSIFLKRAIGLTEVEIGTLSSIYTAMMIFFPIIGGYIADRFGRKKSFMILDSLTWLSALTVWLLSRDIIHALIAYIIESCTSIVYPIWECLLVEDTEPRYRSSIYAYVSIAYTTGMMMTPIAGYIVALYDVDLGCRILFTIAIASLSFMYIIRWIYLREPEVSFRVRRERVLTSFKGYVEVLRVIIRERILLILVLLSIMVTTYYSSTLYTPLYLVDKMGVGLTAGEASLLPFSSSIISLPLLLVIVPRISSKTGYVRALSVGYISGFTATLTLLFSRSVYGVLAAGALFGLYSAVSYSISRTFLTNEVECIDDRYRAKVLSITTTLSSIMNIATPLFVGYVYSIHPKLFILTLSIVLSICFILSMVLKIYVDRAS